MLCGGKDDDWLCWDPLEKSEHGDGSREETLKDFSFAYLFCYYFDALVPINRTSFKDSLVYMFLCEIKCFCSLMADSLV